MASKHWTARAAVLFPNLHWKLFGYVRRGIRPCRQGCRLDGDDQGLRRSGRRNCPQAEATIGMADGASGRVPKARIQDSRPGGDAGSAGCIGYRRVAGGRHRREIISVQRSAGSLISGAGRRSSWTNPEDRCSEFAYGGDARIGPPRDQMSASHPACEA